MRYKQKTADVLNEADRFQRILDFQLFASEQEARLYNFAGKDDQIEWRPGDSIWRHPAVLRFRGSHREEEFGFGPWGNYVRPMIEEFDLIMGLTESVRHRPRVDGSWAIDSTRAYFGDPICCEVWWDRTKEAECWMCGKEWPLLPSFDEFSYKAQGGTYAHVMRALRDEVVRTPERLNETLWQELFRDSQPLSISRAHLHYHAPQIQSPPRYGRQRLFSWVDEIGSWSDAGDYGFVNIETFDYQASMRCETTPFEQPDIRGPLWGSAALYDRLYDEPVAPIVRIPRNWRAQMNRPIPMPVGPPPRDFTEWRSPGVAFADLLDERRGRR